MTFVDSIPDDRGLSREDRAARTRDALDRAALCTDGLRQQWLDRAVELNIGFALSLARAFIGRGEGADDIEQVALLGLIKAARGFDPARGDFLSYAAPTIRGEIKRYYRDLAWTVRPPRRLQDLQAEITHCAHDLEQRLGRSPRPAEVAEALGCSEDEVVEALACSGCYSPASLEGAGVDGAPGLATWLETVESGFDRVEVLAQLRGACRDLDHRDRVVIRMRFFEDRTQSEIAEELGVTQAQVSRLLTRIMSTLRGRISDPALPLAG